MQLNELRDKISNKKTLNREMILFILRWLIVASTFLWWWATSNNPLGIALILVLSSTTLIRMQFSESFLIILIEEAACFISVLYWPAAVFPLILPAFEAGTSGRILTLVPAIFIILFKSLGINLEITLMLNLMAFSIGYIIKAWGDREDIYLKTVDNERRQRYINK